MPYDKMTELWQFQKLIYCFNWWRHRWRHELLINSLHSYSSSPLYQQNIIYMATVPLLREIVRTNILTNRQTPKKHKHTGWKHYQVAIADNEYTSLQAFNSYKRTCTHTIMNFRQSQVIVTEWESVALQLELSIKQMLSLKQHQTIWMKSSLMISPIHSSNIRILLNILLS